MSHQLFNIISSVLVFGVWIYLGVTGFTKLFRLFKKLGFDLTLRKYGFNPNELISYYRRIATTSDPYLRAELDNWKRTTRRLMLIWIITILFFALVYIIVDNTVGFY